MTPRRLGMAFALCLSAAAGPAAADIAEIYAGTWGPAGSAQGRVFQYVSGTTWQEISPPTALGDAVWDLEWDPTRGVLWASVHRGPEADRDDTIPHGTSGHVFYWDRTSWTETTPPAGFSSAATTVSILDGEVLATVDDVGLMRWTGGTDWEVVDEFLLAGQAIVSAVQDGPALYIGQDNQDEFWRYVPGGAPCGTPPARFPLDGKCDPQFPPMGEVCTGDCHGGSCIHAMTQFDDGNGPSVYAGAFFGRIYSWNLGTRLFQRRDDVPLGPHSHFDFLNIQGLAAFEGRLYAAASDGTMWSSTDATSATWTQELDYGLTRPFSDLLAVPEDGQIWMGFGGVPWRWARRDGTPLVRTFDGATVQERSQLEQLVPGRQSEGILVLAAAVPSVECDAGPEQDVECQGASVVAVTLDGSGSQVAKGFPTSYTWTGPFVEGMASGDVVTVHFDGLGDFEVTLTVTVGSLTDSCTTVVHVRDTQPPVGSAQGACLWPPNHRYRCVDAATLLGSASPVFVDACDGQLVGGIVAVSSSQPEDVTGSGDGHTQDDALFDADMVCARSERQGADPAGRDYVVTIAATDSAGNVGLVHATLHVPHDQRTERRCEDPIGGVGLLPHASLPLGPDRREATYP